MRAYEHEPVPDGRTGPYERRPHLKNAVGAIGETHDPRCRGCVQRQQDLEDEHIASEDARLGYWGYEL